MKIINMILPLKPILKNELLLIKNLYIYKTLV